MPFLKITNTSTSLIRNHDFQNNDMSAKAGPVHQHVNMRFGLNIEIEKSVSLVWMNKIDEAKRAQKLETNSLDNNQIKTTLENKVEMQEAYNIDPDTYKDADMVRDYIGLTKKAITLQKSEIDDLELKISQKYREYLVLKDILGGLFNPEI